MTDTVLRLMREADLPECQRLREQAGWNQTPEDWKRFLSFNPEGCFVGVAEERIVGTACTVAYETFGWVAMVIVDRDFRRLGIGRELLRAGIEHLEARGLTVKLDATPAGKLLYDTLGFEDEYGAGRYECGTSPLSSASLSECVPLTRADLDRLDEFDRLIFGNSRRAVLRSYLELYPSHCFVRRRDGEIVGFVMAREGIHAFHIGPWIALDPETARELLASCLQSRQPERVFIDAVDPNLYVGDILTEYGFQLQRPFIRMHRGKNTHPGRPEYVYGMSGPELG